MQVKYVIPKKIPVGGNVYAQSSSRQGVAGISFNEKFGSKPSLFSDALKRDVEKGWHPVGTDTIRSVADHELGHEVDKLLGLSLDPEVIKSYTEAKSKGIKGAVSQYAGKDIHEFIAESWAEYLNNPSPRPVAQTIGEIVRKRYASKFHKD